MSLVKISRYVFIFGSLLLGTLSYGWNSLGHRLIAQIAYNHLSDRAKDSCNHYNRALNRLFRSQNIINSAAWLDTLRYNNQLWLGKIHYIDIPFSNDGVAFTQPERPNAVSAIEEAKALLKHSHNTFDKGFSLRILFHVVGDVHQPLHAVNQFSQVFPHGDKGGNLVLLGRNSVAKNLHAYWDSGGGLLKGGRNSLAQVEKRAEEIEAKWPCQLEEVELEPTLWAKESHQIAVSEAYQIKMFQKPDEAYQEKVKQISEKRIALAGCRLAGLINKLL